MSNYFRINRALLSHDSWLCEKFTRGQAWVDLIGHARWKAGHCVVSGRRINLDRGQLCWSILQLSKRWTWSYGKVKRFLNELQDSNQIDYQNITVTTLISITNYDSYQSGERPNERPDELPDERPDERPDRRPDERQKKKVKKVKKEKKENKGDSSESVNLPPSSRVKWDSNFGFIGINSNDKLNLINAYPACDLDAELRKAHMWLLSNPAKSKKKLFFRFITSWLGRCQERGGGMQSNRIGSVTTPIDKLLLQKFHAPLKTAMELTQVYTPELYQTYLKDQEKIPGHLKSQMHEEADQ